MFISFDYDHDRDLHGDLVAQAARPDSPFSIADQSPRNAIHDGNWKSVVRERIRRVDVVVFICGANTHSAPGVEAEMSITQGAGKPYFLLRGRKLGASKPPNTPLSKPMQAWTWANLKRLLG